MEAITPALVLFSVLFPSKLWFTPNQPISITVKVRSAIQASVLEIQEKSKGLLARSGSNRVMTSDIARIRRRRADATRACPPGRKIKWVGSDDQPCSVQTWQLPSE